jgi:hypothetical protein
MKHPLAGGRMVTHRHQVGQVAESALDGFALAAVSLVIAHDPVASHQGLEIAVPLPPLSDDNPSFSTAGRECKLDRISGWRPEIGLPMTDCEIGLERLIPLDFAMACHIGGSASGVSRGMAGLQARSTFGQPCGIRLNRRRRLHAASRLSVRASEPAGDGGKCCRGHGITSCSV